MRALLQSGASIDNPRVHGYLMAISLGLLLPLSIVISRNFKEYSNAVRVYAASSQLNLRHSLSATLRAPMRERAR